MYQSYFGLTEAPFSIAPDPRYLYMSQRHQEALAHLLYGVNAGGGFVLLTGEVGAGKTTVCRCLLEQIPESCDVAYIFNPKLTVAELLSTICLEFGITYPPGNTSIKVFVDCINAYLLDANARGRHTVLIIDEAQNLSADVLEEMRLLTNLETSQRKLLQIILLGQPELAAMLERPELRQLAQRVVARYHLGPLTRPEVAAYVRHRLDMSGAQRPLFPAALMGRLYRLSGGVPRVINVLCDRALLGTYVQSKERVDRATLAQAAREVFHQPAAGRRNMMRPLLAVLVLLACGAVALAVYQREPRETGTATLTSASANPAAPMKAADPVKDARPVAALPDRLEWPDDEPRARSRAIAYAALFQAWGLDDQGPDACQQAQDQGQAQGLGLGLRCRTARGGLDELRLYNRPAVLLMRDAEGLDQGHHQTQNQAQNQGQNYYAALTGLDDKSATFAIGPRTRTVALGALAAQWSGHYTLLWRMLPDAPKTIRPGERGPAVQWLGKQLAQMQGRVGAPPTDPVFDDALVRRLKQFQLAQGLVPDGALGPQTLTHLSSVADQAAPKLRGEQRGK
jgi:general secretion pathway protein A